MTQSERALAEAAFWADELRLFLDTHPGDVRARADYRTAAELVQKRRNELRYAVNALDAGKGCDWDWTRTPWPWEKEE